MIIDIIMFRSYIDLLATDDTEYDRTYSPTPPPLSPITPDDQRFVVIHNLKLHAGNIMHF